MKLLKDKWGDIYKTTENLMRLLPPEKRKSKNPHENEMEADLYATYSILKEAETIIFPTDTMLELIHNIDRIDCRGWLHLPYPYLLIQFTEPISEKVFMVYEEMSPELARFGILGDSVEGFAICNTIQDKSYQISRTLEMMNGCVLFTSTAVNRVGWKGTDKVSVPDWSKSFYKPEMINPKSLENKQRIIQLAYLIDLFLNAPNVTIDRKKVDPKIQKKRERKGKTILPEYHTVTIQKIVTSVSSGKKAGIHHSYMYPVRGHFRRYKHLDKPVWIPNHFRGLQHGEESQKKEIYKIRPDNPDKNVVQA